MSVIAALLLLSSKGEPDVVYCARTYKQGKAKSHYSMFLCRHDGTGKKQISRPNEVVTTATWIDDHTIGYLRVREPSGEFTRLPNHHGTICTLDLSTGRRRELKQIKLVYFAIRSFQEKGVLEVEASDYVLSKVGIVTTKPSKDDYFGIGKDLPANQEFTQFTEIKTPSGLARLEWTRSFDEDSESKIKVQLRFPKGRTFNLWLLGGDIYDFRVLGKQLFLQTHNPASQHDRTTFTHQIDCESGEVQTDHFWGRGKLLYPDKTSLACQ